MNMDVSMCMNGRCSYTFEPSNPPSSYDNVSVAAENVVGRGAARMCTTQSISKLPCTEIIHCVEILLPLHITSRFSV